ncbi:radical SAM protein [Candidatus Mcinerneyibacteriota bacterium]|nr:radical SAM protein [Candidatus Mcinerneyibacteriota bacterium]
MIPRYIQNRDRLKALLPELKGHLEKCSLCPRRCQADRRVRKGACGVGAETAVALFQPFFYEEPPVSGTQGAGNVFFTGCNLTCLFCQNYEISQEHKGVVLSVEELAVIFLRLQNEDGVHNINLVSPTPHLPFIIPALLLAADRGLTIPVVYNTNGYETSESVEMIALFADIFLPDLKYVSRETSAELSGSADYPHFAWEAVEQMITLNGYGKFSSEGVMEEGVIIRHLVLPGYIDESLRLLEEIRRRLGKYVPVSVMSQYTPVWKAKEHPILKEPLKKEEYQRIIDKIAELGFENGWVQDPGSAGEDYIPRFLGDKVQLFRRKGV